MLGQSLSVLTLGLKPSVSVEGQAGPDDLDKKRPLESRQENVGWSTLPGLHRRVVMERGGER